MHTEAKDKANILNKQYESIFTREDGMSIPVPDGTPYPSMPEIEVSSENAELTTPKSYTPETVSVIGQFLLQNSIRIQNA